MIFLMCHVIFQYAHFTRTLVAAEHLIDLILCFHPFLVLVNLFLFCFYSYFNLFHSHSFDRFIILIFLLIILIFLSHALDFKCYCSLGNILNICLFCSPLIVLQSFDFYLINIHLKLYIYVEIYIITFAPIQLFVLMQFLIIDLYTFLDFFFYSH